MGRIAWQSCIILCKNCSSAHNWLLAVVPLLCRVVRVEAELCRPVPVGLVVEAHM